MENTLSGVYGQENHITNFSHETNQNSLTNDDLGSIFPTSDFYDEGGNYKSDAFESLGSLHYMNYLHSHDDML